MNLDPTKPVIFKELDFEEISRLAQNNDPQALLIGSYILEGTFDLIDEVDEAAAAHWAQKAAQTGDAVCMHRYGHMLIGGMGTPLNTKEGKKLVGQTLNDLKKFAESGQLFAQVLYGLSLNRGFGDIQDQAQRKAEAAEWYRLAAVGGEPIAQFNHGADCLDGDGIPKNSDLALDWLTRSYNQGFAPACNNLAIWHERFAKDDLTAFQYYSEGARKGDLSSTGNAAQYCGANRVMHEDCNNAEALRLNNKILSYSWITAELRSDCEQRIRMLLLGRVLRTENTGQGKLYIFKDGSESFVAKPQRPAGRPQSNKSRRGGPR